MYVDKLNAEQLAVVYHGVFDADFPRKAAEAIARSSAELAESVAAFDKALDALKAITYAQPGTSLVELAEQQYRMVATPRQWYLYKRGKPRVRKKWEAAFCRKYDLRAKRGETSGI